MGELDLGKTWLPSAISKRSREIVLRSTAYRTVQRASLARRLGLPRASPPRRPGKLGALLRVKNEDFWIELIVRTLCKVLDEVVIIDTGSEDHTLQVVAEIVAEGLPVRVFPHAEHPRKFNLIANLVVDRTFTAEYLYIVDGDELQLEASVAACVEEVKRASTSGVWYLTTHHLFVHPKSITRCTPPFSDQVRYQAGRIQAHEHLRFSEAHINDGIELAGRPRTAGVPAARRGFVEAATTLHLPFSRRSTIASWKGHDSLVGPRNYRERRYLASDDHYVDLPYFPKEIHECRFSSHNSYFRELLAADIPLV